MEWSRHTIALCPQCLHMPQEALEQVTITALCFVVATLSPSLKPHELPSLSCALSWLCSLWSRLLHPLLIFLVVGSLVLTILTLALLVSRVLIPALSVACPARQTRVAELQDTLGAWEGDRIRHLEVGSFACVCFAAHYGDTGPLLACVSTPLIVHMCLPKSYLNP